MLDKTSSDAKYLYNMCIGIVDGDITVVEEKVGKMCHSRWLTFAGRILRLYVSQPSLHAYEENKLQRMANAVVCVYYNVSGSCKCPQPNYKHRLP